MIANWLLLHGIEYEYEKPYRHANTSTSTRPQYRPDFYLPEHNVYLEHFGIQRDGRTAPCVDRDKYHCDMAWKRQLHQERKTTLVETYSYERTEGALLTGLDRKLRAVGFHPAPIPTKRLRNVLQASQQIRPVTRLLKTFLNLFKSHPCTLEGVRDEAQSSVEPARAQAFLDLFEIVYGRYEEQLRSEGTIDFHDMISRARDHVRHGRYRSPFTCIIVDEFQDISPGRAELLKALLDRSEDPRLFCVGDDWQSIYRFTGSDIGLMTGFADHFGVTRRTDLDRTFRFNDRLLAASTRFITANPEQLQKEWLFAIFADALSGQERPGAPRDAWPAVAPTARFSLSDRAFAAVASPPAGPRHRPLRRSIRRAQRGIQSSRKGRWRKVRDALGLPSIP